AADAQHHRPVPPQQGREGNPVAPVEVVAQQFAVGPPAAVARQGGPAEVLEQVELSGGHRIPLPRSRHALLPYIGGSPSVLCIMPALQENAIVIRARSEGFHAPTRRG